MSCLSGKKLTAYETACAKYRKTNLFWRPIFFTITKTPQTINKALRMNSNNNKSKAHLLWIHRTWLCLSRITHNFYRGSLKEGKEEGRRHFMYPLASFSKTFENENTKKTYMEFNFIFNLYIHCPLLTLGI
jgi:hypothetical protein